MVKTQHNKHTKNMMKEQLFNFNDVCFVMMNDHDVDGDEKNKNDN